MPDELQAAKKDGYKPDKYGDYHSLHLFPLTEVHFNAQLGGGGAVSKSFLYTLILN